jgi:ankyrin repeat protein
MMTNSTLHQACAYNEIDRVEELLADHAVDVNAKNGDGDTSLQIAYQ